MSICVAICHIFSSSLMRMSFRYHQQTSILLSSYQATHHVHHLRPSRSDCSERIARETHRLLSAHLSRFLSFFHRCVICFNISNTSFLRGQITATAPCAACLPVHRALHLARRYAITAALPPFHVSKQQLNVLLPHSLIRHEGIQEDMWCHVSKADKQLLKLQASAG